MTNTKNWFASWFDSPYYHILYKNRDYKEAEIFIRNLTHYLKPNPQDEILDLACGAGRHSIFLNSLGYKVTGVDLSEKAIETAQNMAAEMGVDTKFVCCDVYSLPELLNQKFDYVFTSYGTVGWLPDSDKWASVISHFLKPKGKFIFVEFHPVIWMHDDDFEFIKYNYFNEETIKEIETGTYTNSNASIEEEYINWNHSIGEVTNSLINNGLSINSLKEYNYSPYNCFNKLIEFEPGKFQVEHFGNKIPMVYSLVCTKN